ncbi:PucR family transcriptional regulator [Microbacterium ulmi]|uniref:PucR family transcriptional regulator n=1 Tax=Microbacterium ulmi TaxID=179095 RepID=A0A7Y2Q0U0_9MICO|nr:PucR family transcriptional regulator [Microbacterium ulmi]NII68695.1 purine catabolism regulator [Microbacterium ulmi]NNH03642.1 PucR family transcriptional regulator [Microbacterium ulmi]
MDAAPDAPTLRSLLRRHDLRLRLEGDEADLEPDALDRPIRWIHSSDLADPTPFLSEGLALLTTGTQFREAGEDAVPYADYVRRLAARGVLGLGFGTEVVRDGIPPALADACRAERMPLFEVPYRTPFIAVARANAEAIAGQAYARRSWSLAAQRAISLAALRPDGLGATLAELARQFETWVGLFDASGALAREHPAGALDADVLAALADDVGAVLRRGARAGSALHVGGTPFTLQTLGRGGHLRGVIAIAAGDLDQEGRGVLTAVIAMAGLALEQNEGLSRARGLLRAGLVPSLLSDDPSLARRIARDLWGGLPQAPVVVAVTDAAPARSDAASEWLELRATDTRGAVFYGRGDEGLVLVVGAADTSALDEFASRFGIRLGASEPTAYTGFSAAHGQAATALRRATAGVLRFGEVAASGVLSALDTDAARALARARLAPLRESDERAGTALVETVRAWLDNDARIDAAATALGVHRHTVRARIGQAERLLETDLASFAARAELWAALVAG